MNMVPVVGVSALGTIAAIVLLVFIPLCVVEFYFQPKQRKKIKEGLIPPYHLLYRVVHIVVAVLVVFLCIVSVIISSVERVSEGVSVISTVLIALLGVVLGSAMYIGVALALTDLGFLPYLIAHSRGHRNQNAILIMTFLGSWTIVLWIAALIWAFTNPAPVMAQQVSIADELKKYKKLLDEGVITQEEFEKKKKSLLDR